jgi:hypothetical protein
LVENGESSLRKGLRVISQFDPALWAPLAVGIQIFGLLTACLTRISRGSRGQASCAALFCITLVAVAFSTMASIPLCHAGGWLAGGANLGMMVLLVVWERPTLAIDDRG